MLNFDFFEKSLKMVSPLNFVYDFSGELALMLHFLN